MLVILAIWEAEIKRIILLGQPRQTVCETPRLRLGGSFFQASSSKIVCEAPSQQIKTGHDEPARVGSIK
jgi:hypothetical protein